MNNDDAKQFLEELEDSGGDIECWSKRKDRENASFYGFEIDPEKEKRLNRLKALCASLAEIDDTIILHDEPLTSRNRHGRVQLSLPPLFFTADPRAARILSDCFYIADHFAVAAPRIINEDADDEDFVGERVGREVLITFEVEDMWKTYGKAPFI